MRRRTTTSSAVLVLCMCAAVSASADCNTVTERMMLVQGSPSNGSSAPINVGAVPIGAVPCAPPNEDSRLNYSVTPEIYKQQLLPTVRQDCAIAIQYNNSAQANEKYSGHWNVTVYNNGIKIVECSIPDSDLTGIFELLKQDKRNIVPSNK